MIQMPLFQPPTWSVTELTRYLRELMEEDKNLQELWVQGEVSNLSRPSSGHMYFTLKDESSSVRCVMWRNSAIRQSFLPRDGDAIEVHGAISIYEAAGQYQLYADLIRPAGEGKLYREFLQLKARLEAEGLFDADRKRPAPHWPCRIGVITSPSGAALRDILNTLRRRYPLAEVILAATAVQGEEAVPGIVTALQTLNLEAKPDVILLARGGGSIEDLWAFNDERVARAIASSQAPVITGIGHETDFTIADFVSDLRAPTPTAAAEMATPNQVDLRLAVAELSQQLTRLIAGSLKTPRLRMVEIQNRLRLSSPRSRLRTDRQRIDELTRRASVGLTYSLQLKQARLAGLRQRLEALSPLGVLARGYAVVTRQEGGLVRSVRQVQKGDALNVRVSDGQFHAQVDGAKDG